MISLQSVKLQLGTKKQGLRKGYQDTLDKILNLGNSSSKCLDNVIKAFCPKDKNAFMVLSMFFFFSRQNLVITII